MTRQEIFDKVVKAIIEQGGPSADFTIPAYGPKSRCMYRGPNGRKCAAGHLIPDDKYDPSLEGGAAFCSSVRDAMPEVTESDYGLVETLQAAHDAACNDVRVDDLQRPPTDAEFLVKFRHNAREFVMEYGLDTSMCDFVPTQEVQS